MNLDFLHCLHVIFCVCNLAKMIISTEGKALVDTITDGYDQRLASHYHVKEGANVTVQVQSQTLLHRNTNVHKYRNNNYRLTEWMYKQRRLMINTYFEYEKVDGKNGNNKVGDSVSVAKNRAIDKQLDLLLLHYPVTYTRIKRDLSEVRKKSSQTNNLNRDSFQDIMTRGKRAVLPDKYKSDDLSESPESKPQGQDLDDSGPTAFVRKVSILDLVTKVMRIKNPTNISRTMVPFKKNPIPHQVRCFVLQRN